MEVDIAKIEMQEYKGYIPFLMEKPTAEKITQDISKYCYIIYTMDIKNISDKTYVKAIDIQPNFSLEMQDRVVFFEPSDINIGIHEEIPQNSSRSYFRSILIDRQGLTDEEVLNMANGNNLKIRYQTTNWNSIFDTGFHKYIVKP